MKIGANVRDNIRKSVWEIFSFAASWESDWKGMEAKCSFHLIQNIHETFIDDEALEGTEWLVRWWRGLATREINRLETGGNK